MNNKTCCVVWLCIIANKNLYKTEKINTFEHNRFFVVFQWIKTKLNYEREGERERERDRVRQRERKREKARMENKYCMIHKYCLTLVTSAREAYPLSLMSTHFHSS